MITALALSLILAQTAHTTTETVSLIAQDNKDFCRPGCPDACLVGYIIQKLGKNTYEVSFNGEENDDRPLYVLLNTKYTSFDSAGFFSLCIDPKVKLKKLKVSRGFTRDVFSVTEAKNNEQVKKR